MKEIIRVPLNLGDSIMCSDSGQPGCTREKAVLANAAFDSSVKEFLRSCVDRSTISVPTDHTEGDYSFDEFIEKDALRSFFRHTDDAMEQLLEQPAIAHHLLRPVSEVYFQYDAYEPLFSTFEQRIYNLAAQREHLEVPFRYCSINRQGPYADIIGASDLPEGQWREDIGVYFGTRRSNETALTLLARKLRRDVVQTSSLPIHVITEGYMEDSLRVVKKITEHLQGELAVKPHCFLIQRRHAADDRHLGAALLIMNPSQPNLPQRVIFCDTLNPSGTPPWWHSFKRKLDSVFPQPHETSPVSAMLEDGGVKLQRLHDGVPVRHQDIDCAFYTASIVQALVQLAQSEPDLLLTSTITEIVSQMTARMPDYYEVANQPRNPELIREVNVIRRWNIGQEALTNLLLSRLSESSLHQPYIAELTLKA
jgi:hypothetical protein